MEPRQRLFGGDAGYVALANTIGALENGRGLVGLAGVPGLTEALDVLIGTLKKVEVRLLRSRKRHEIVSWQFAGH